MSATAMPALVSDNILVQLNPSITQTLETGEEHVDNIFDKGCVNTIDVDRELLEKQLHPCADSIYSNQNTIVTITGMQINNCN